MLHYCIGSGECALAQGELAYLQGELLVLFELWIGGLCSLLEHGFCLGCVEPLPLPKGSDSCSSSSDHALCLSLAFDRLLEFLFIHFLFFCFSPRLQIMCVVNALIKGQIEDHVWSRTGGWSLPGVMSD
jgi:hypothetical protein